MTHTNHRTGPASSFQDDYVVLVMPAKGHNDTTKAPEKLKRTFDILMLYEPVNAGGINAGNLISNTPAQIRATIGPNTPMIHGVYTDRGTVRQVVQAIKEADQGLSVVVTGLIDEVADMANSVGLSVHSTAYALGIQGNQALLPPPDILEITSMCGHGLIPVDLVKNLITQISLGRITSLQAARALGVHCVCGVFNPVKAVRLFEAAVSNKKGDYSDESAVF